MPADSTPLRSDESSSFAQPSPGLRPAGKASEDRSEGQAGSPAQQAEQPAAYTPGTETPLDGVASVASIPAAPVDTAQARRKLLLLLAVGGIFLIFYLVFAVFLMATLPDPSGGKQVLRFFGNFFFIGMSVGAVLLLGLLAVRLLRAGLAPVQFGRMLLRPAIIVLAMLGIAGMVYITINGEIPLPIDVLEPSNLRALTAPVTVTFGTESLRTILRKQSFFPQRYKWDFDGNGTFEVEQQDHEVTTSYRRKGVYNVVLLIQLSDGTVRQATTRLVIPSGVFSINPPNPLLNEPVEFDAVDLVSNPQDLDLLLWDFDGDGTVDAETHDMKAAHTYSQLGTYQAQVIVQAKSGIQDRYVRPVTVAAELPQPFSISIEAEGPLKGSAPLGVIFKATVQEGVIVREVRWHFTPEGKVGESKAGERVAHTLTEVGKYQVTLEVQDVMGRVARKMQSVSVLEPLKLADLVISGTPKPVQGKSVEGMAPLEVRLSAQTKTPFISFKWEQEYATRVFSVEPEYHALYEKPGTYPLLLIARDAEDRVQKVPLEIVVQAPKARVVLTAVPPTGIAPLTVTFDASQSSVPEGRITGFSWTFGDEERDVKPQILGAQVTHRYEKEGTYTVIVRALTEEGQSFETRKTIVVRSPTLDACAFPSRTVGSAPLGVRFDATCSTGTITKYMWDFGDGATSETETPTQDHIFSIPGTYTVKLEVADGKGNFSTATVTITVR